MTILYIIVYIYILYIYYIIYVSHYMTMDSMFIWHQRSDAKWGWIKPSYPKPCWLNYPSSWKSSKGRSTAPHYESASWCYFASGNFTRHSGLRRTPKTTVRCGSDTNVLLRSSKCATLKLEASWRFRSPRNFWGETKFISFPSSRFRMNHITPQLKRMFVNL